MTDSQTPQNSPDSLPTESAPVLTLGIYLRQQREARGITIEQLASATKINVRILQSLEEDQFKELPAKPFIRGFVTSYARFIGLDSKELLLKFDEFITLRSQDRPIRDAGHSGYAFDRKDSEQSRTLLWIVMGSFMFVGGILWVFLKPNLHHKRSAHVEKLKSAQPAGVESQPVSVPSSDVKVPESVPSAAPAPLSAEVSPSPAPTPVAVPTLSQAELVPAPVVSPAHDVTQPVAILATPTPDDPLASGVGLKGEEIKYKILLKALADVWVRYQSDGRPKMQFVLRKDKVLVLRASTRLMLQVSNSSAITGRINGGKESPVADWKAQLGPSGARYLFGGLSSVAGPDPFADDKSLPKTQGVTPSDATN